MANNDPQTITLSCSENYVIPKGYHDGTGKVMSKDLGSQTPATALAGDILSGKTAWVNGQSVTGSMPSRYQGIDANSAAMWEGSLYYRIPYGYYPNTYTSTECELKLSLDKVRAAIGYTNPLTVRVGTTIAGMAGTLNVQSAYSFSCAAIDWNRIDVYWINPAVGPYSGVSIQTATGGYPGYGGTQKYVGLGWDPNPSRSTGAGLFGLAPNTTYYLSVFSYCTCNDGTQNFHGPLTNLVVTTPSKPSGYLAFTTSQVWTVPAGVYVVDVCIVGGGGAGGFNGRHAGGGGSGYVNNHYGINVQPGQQINIIIGAGGVGGTNGVGNNGNISYFGSYTAGGGFGGTGGNKGGAPATEFYYFGGNGGSGGGNAYIPGPGGADGSDGRVNQDDVNAGIGQHFTTRAFGGTLYAGGGAGENNTIWKANGGAGGGGNSRTNGAPGTGGGGGGYSYSSVTTNGGSGVVVVRW